MTDEKQKPLLRTYRVGLVIPQCGINAAQVADVRARLRSIAHVLPADGNVLLLIPGYDARNPKAGIQEDVLEMARASKVTLEWFGVRAKDGKSAARICAALDHCDEVWCCTDENHTHNGRTRASAVLRLGGQRGLLGPRYKHIPTWVTAAPPPERPAQVRPLW